MASESAFAMEEVSACLKKCLQFTKKRTVTERNVVASLGYHLAEDLVAKTNVPNVQTSIMDGYAISTQATSLVLQVAGKLLAGEEICEDQFHVNQCIYVTTGSPIPIGVDAVIPIEHTKYINDGESIMIPKIPSSGSWIREIGSDMVEGDIILSKGTKITAAEVGICAVGGYATIPVFEKPKVGVLSTGNELVQAQEIPQPGQTRDCNRPMLQSCLLEIGLDGTKIIDYGICSDVEDNIQNIISQALEEVDILITSGAASMGIRDYMKPILEERGKIHFGRMKMKPGKPTTFATIPKSDESNLLVFALPGNPVSCFVTFNLVVSPTIKALSGSPNIHLPKIQTKLADPIKLDPIRPEYHRASLSVNTSGQFEASSTGMQRSSRILSLKDADCLLHLPNQAGILPKGTMVEASVLNSLRCRGPKCESGNAPNTESLEASAFRSLVSHFKNRTDVQNIDLMNLSGFCRNCLSKWYKNASEAAGMPMSYDKARELVYGMPYKKWKKKYQTPATPEQMEKFKKTHGGHQSHGSKPVAIKNKTTAAVSNKHSDVCCSKFDGKKESEEAILKAILISLGVITVSTRASKGIYEDKSGPEIIKQVTQFCSEQPACNLTDIQTKLVPDGFQEVYDAIQEMQAKGCNLILTTGGTGFSPDDVTPEATSKILTKTAPSIMNAIQNHVSQQTKLACLSRGVAGVYENSFILNLPGRQKAVIENLEFAMPIIAEALDSMKIDYTAAQI